MTGPSRSRAQAGEDDAAAPLHRVVRHMLSAEAEAILAEAARWAAAVIDQAGLAPVMREPEGFWSGA